VQSYFVITPRPVYSMLGGFTGAAVGFGLPFAASFVFPGLPVGFWFALMLGLVIWLSIRGMRLGARRERVSWVADALHVESLGGGPTRQIPRRQIKSFFFEPEPGPSLRLRLHDGRNLVFGPPSGRRDELEPFIGVALTWLQQPGGSAEMVPRREPSFWERPVATGLVGVTTLLMLGLTGWLLLRGLPAGRPAWELLPEYLAYAGMVTAWWRARRGKSVAA
jgi:hypothetical protein